MNQFGSQFKAADEFSKRMRALVRPEWLVRFEAINRAQLDWQQRMAKLSQPFMQAHAAVARFEEALARARAPYAEMFERIAKVSEQAERLEKAGWLPHASMPFDALEDKSLNPEEMSEVVEAHYRENWPAISEEFAASIAACDLDNEATATFAEALNAHGAGWYRLTSRALFPEIERVARAEIHAGAMDKIASQHVLRDAAGELTPGELAPSGVHGMALYHRLQDHLYANLTTEADLSKILASSVPNRHAAVHGYSAYGTFKASLNALIIAEFIFRTISALKRRALWEEEDEAA